MSTEIDKLVGLIKDCNLRYRAGNPLITDQAYDRLLEELAILSPNHELFSKGVIETSPSDRKRKLPILMYSLDKVKTLEELLNWVRLKKISLSTEVVITGKYDAISLCVDEILNRCWTRGDGEFGQLSNEHYKLVKNTNPIGYSAVQKNSEFTFGEAIISKKDFEQFKGEYAAARNLAAGLFNKKDPTDKLKAITYMRYGWNNDQCLNHDVELKYLNTLNAVPVPYKVIKISNLTEDILDDLYNEWSTDFEIDGLVIDINDYKLRQCLGRETNLNPAYARAVKLAKWVKTVVTKVLDIEWGVGKNGVLSPVLIVEEVDFNGVKINRVTGYNWRYLCDNHICIGALIEITRSGDVIPKHLNTITWDEIKYQQIFQMDQKSVCPSCGKPLELDETEVNLFCTNNNCPEQQIKKIIHFFKALEFDNVGEGELRNLYNKGYHNVESIWNITNRELSLLNGWGMKSINAFMNQITAWNEKGIGIAKYLYALDLFNDALGKKTIQLIIDDLTEEEVKDLEYMVGRTENYYYSQAFVERLLCIKGVAGITAKIFIQGLMKYYMNNSYHSIIEYVIWKTEKPVASNNNFANFKVCFSGFRNKDMEAQIISGGGEIVSGVSKNTTHLVVKDVNSTSSKTIKAKELGIEVDSEATFAKKLI